ncbi:MAG: fibronectin type III domain-containing protein, partial [Candidatus Omnitrophica bacterium]|nr:fibronectin type III domain-containing protein [Candidatus Omnitrophota bacterium]
QGDALVAGGLAPILGGRYEDLLEAFLFDPYQKGKRLGLDGLDAISVEDGVLTRAFFTVEEPFRVSNPAHPAFGTVVSDGDLLGKSGLIVPNAFLLAPFDLKDDEGMTAGEVGLDAVDVEGIDPEEYDRWTNSYLENLDSTPPSDIIADASVYFSFEEVNEVYNASAGIPVSADDLLCLGLNTMVGKVFRSGADQTPAGSPGILLGYYPNPADSNVGLDAVDMPNHLPESDENGETGPINRFAGDIFFSTSLDDIQNPNRFTEGDLLASDSGGGNRIQESQSGLTGLVQGPNLGLDGFDCLGDIEVKMATRTRVCRPLFIPGSVTVADVTGIARIPLWSLNSCAVKDSVEIAFRYPTAFFGSSIAVHPGPNFRLQTPKGNGDGEFGPFTLERTQYDQEDELLATLEIPLVGAKKIADGTLEWVRFRADDEIETASSVPPALVYLNLTPSKPILKIPDVGGNDVKVCWFPNSASENVTAYGIRVLNSSGEEVASEEVPAGSDCIVLEGLDSARDYTVETVAVNGFGESRPCAVEITTRPRENTSVTSVLELLARDWRPLVNPNPDFQGTVPSPVDFNLDDTVNSNDALLLFNRLRHK